MKFIYLFLTITLFFSCKKEIENAEIVLEDDVYRLVNEYVNHYPQFNTFVLRYSLQTSTINDTIIEQGYLLGPGYNDVLKNSKLSVYFELGSKRVYYVSDANNLLKVNRKEIKKWKSSNMSDSICLDTLKNSYSVDWVIKNGEALFMYRAIFFRFDETGNIKVNHRPDTIFLPKYKGEIRFGT